MHSETRRGTGLIGEAVLPRRHDQKLEQILVIVVGQLVPGPPDHSRTQCFGVVDLEQRKLLAEHPHLV